MNCRRHGSKPTIALWMLIAIADLVILVAATGVTMVLILAGLIALAGGVVAARAVLGRPADAGEAVSRRRA